MMDVLDLIFKKHLGKLEGTSFEKINSMQDFMEVKNCCTI